jgi:hypothetical protein
MFCFISSRKHNTSRIKRKDQAESHGFAGEKSAVEADFAQDASFDASCAKTPRRPLRSASLAFQWMRPALGGSRGCFGIMVKLKPKKIRHRVSK